MTVRICVQLESLKRVALYFGIGVLSIIMAVFWLSAPADPPDCKMIFEGGCLDGPPQAQEQASPPAPMPSVRCKAGVCEV